MGGCYRMYEMGAASASLQCGRRCRHMAGHATTRCERAHTAHSHVRVERDFAVVAPRSQRGRGPGCVYIVMSQLSRGEYKLRERSMALNRIAIWRYGNLVLPARCEKLRDFTRRLPIHCDASRQPPCAQLQPAFRWFREWARLSMGRHDGA